MKNNMLVKNDSLGNYSKALLDDKYLCRKGGALDENLLYANTMNPPLHSLCRCQNEIKIEGNTKQSIGLKQICASLK